MRIMVCHCYYVQRGGEDESFEAEAKLLESRGHNVVRFVMDNDTINDMSSWTAARKILWNQDIYRQTEELILKCRPAVMHCTNTFPLMSPAVYYAARRHGVPVVQALRNYRMLCPSAILFRNQSVCENCLGKSFSWPAIVHACYRDSRVATTVVTLQNALQRLFGTWKHAVDRYFTPSEFTRRKFIESGLPAERISVKPNFVFPDLGVCQKGDYAVFVGRLTVEKGIQTLLDAWKALPCNVPLKIVGEGPLSVRVREMAERDARIIPLGQLPAHEVLDVIGRAKLLVMPSNWYETFGRVIIEAFSRATPVLASRLGAMSEVVTDGKTGLLFEPGSASDLAEKAAALLNDPHRIQQMGECARQDYQVRFSANRNYELLMQIYADAGASLKSGGDDSTDSLWTSDSRQHLAEETRQLNVEDFAAPDIVDVHGR